MNSTKLTSHLAIDKLKPIHDGKRHRYVIKARGIASGSLLVLVTPNGRKTFYTRASFRHKRIDIRLGNFPAVGLKRAIELHNNCMRQIDEGHDPRKIKAAEKQLNEAALTMNELFIKWYEFALATGTSKRTTIDAHLWRYQSYLRGSLGNLLVKDLTRSNILSTLEDCVRRSPEQARKCFSTLSLSLEFGLKRMMITENPMRTLQPKDVNATKGKPRSRFLNIGEIKKLWLELDARITSHTPQMINIVKLALITGARRGELVSMKWSDLIERDGYWIWNISETKNGRPHRIYLHSLAISLLNQLKPVTGNCTWVFASNKSIGKPLRADAITKFIGRLNKAMTIAPFCLHDLRRSAATHWIEKIKADSALVELLLNHLPHNQLVRTYQVVTREADQICVTGKWNDFLINLNEVEIPPK